MKCRCPYCQVASLWAKEGICPACGKAALPPGFYTRPSRASSRASTRDEGRAVYDTAVPWFGAGGLWRVFAPRSLYARLTLWVGLVCVVGAALYGPRQAPLSSPEIVDLARDNLAVLRAALELFREDCGRYPSSAEGLAALVSDPGVDGWHGPYVHNMRPDPWSHPFLYRGSPTCPRLLSAGPDGVEGTADDVEAGSGRSAPAPPAADVKVGGGVPATPRPGGSEP